MGEGIKEMGGSNSTNVNTSTSKIRVQVAVERRFSSRIPKALVFHYVKSCLFLCTFVFLVSIYIHDI